MRFTIRRNGHLVGTYAGDDETAALNAMAKDEGFPDFNSCNKSKGLVRDDYTVEAVKE